MDEKALKNEVISYFTGTENHSFDKETIKGFVEDIDNVISSPQTNKGKLQLDNIKNRVASFTDDDMKEIEDMHQ